MLVRVRENSRGLGATAPLVVNNRIPGWPTWARGPIIIPYRTNGQAAPATSQPAAAPAPATVQPGAIVGYSPSGQPLYASSFSDINAATAAAATAASSTSSITDFLTGSAFYGIPNWVLLLGVGFGIYAMSSHRR